MMGLRSYSIKFFGYYFPNLEPHHLKYKSQPEKKRFGHSLHSKLVQYWAELNVNTLIRNWTLFIASTIYHQQYCNCYKWYGNNSLHD